MTESSNHEFGDRLASLEPTTPALRERYDAKMHTLLNATLSPQQRWGGIWFIACYSLLLIVVLLQPDARQRLIVEIWPFGTIALAGGAVFAALTAYRTTRRFVHELHDAPFLEAANVLIITCFAVAMFVAAIRIDNTGTETVGHWASTTTRTGLIGLAALLVVVAAVGTVAIMIRWHSMRTRLALLELECTIARLSEALEKDRTPESQDRTS
jgi:hypothetical protein